MGKAAVAFLKWQLKGDAAGKAEFCGTSPTSELAKLEFKVQSQNMC
jgi:hypothetical protein